MAKVSDAEIARALDKETFERGNLDPSRVDESFKEGEVPEGPRVRYVLDEPGEYVWSVLCVSDSYIGLDQTVEVRIVVG